MCRVRRTGRYVDGASHRVYRHAGGVGGVLASELRAGDARRHRQLQRYRQRPPNRITDHIARCTRGDRDEPAVDAQIRNGPRRRRTSGGKQIAYRADPERAGLTVLDVAANEIAAELGNAKAANMVMLGAFVGSTGLFPLESVVDALKKVFGPKKAAFLELNRNALYRGSEMAGHPVS